MAKKEKQVREIASVELRNQKEPLDIPRLGMYITPENLTIERYLKLVTISHHYEQFFKVTYKTKNHEQSKVETA